MNRWKLEPGMRYHVEGEGEPFEVYRLWPRRTLDPNELGGRRLLGYVVDGWSRDGRRLTLDPERFGDSVGLRRCPDHGEYDADLGPICPGCGGPTGVALAAITKADRLAS